MGGVLKGSGRRKYRFTIRDLLADKRCSQVVLDFLSATDVGRLVPAEEDAGSEASECELRERNEERRAEAEEVGAAGGIFFFGLFITRMRPIRPWRDYVQSVSCPLSA